ncbi:hypothetical protein ANCCAN_10919 [Ancylostoma caninum]|uniref:DUF5641 domain-containing protein n=1 Tax=Ancylostoma caninum TaxID=29170 RepID=A0A368GFD4_ANCCA|nr:hypothetical protein ANCCAN_10919 [Ancylostoma caninum]
MLNTRPLLYVESELPTEHVLRPIDFLQNEFEIPTPLDTGLETGEDPEYASPEERLTWRTKKQVVESIQSSCKLTERFWQTWQSHYLTSLREKHERVVNKKRGSASVPTKGKLVLISDALQPRHSWKMGHIVELVANKEGVVRGAVVMLPTHRKIRRPLNLLVPLELDDDDFEVSEAKESTADQKGEPPNQTTDKNAKKRWIAVLHDTICAPDRKSTMLRISRPNILYKSQLY